MIALNRTVAQARAWIMGINPIPATGSTSSSTIKRNKPNTSQRVRKTYNRTGKKSTAGNTVNKRPALIEKKFIMGLNQKVHAHVYKLADDAMFVKRFIKVTNKDSGDIIPTRSLNKLLFYHDDKWIAVPTVSKLSDAIEAYAMWVECNRDVYRYSMWFRKRYPR